MRNYFIIDHDNFTIQSIKDVLEDYFEFNCIGTSSDYNSAMNIKNQKTLLT
jgi:DNA-binding NarL/FixJ family response regulator